MNKKTNKIDDAEDVSEEKQLKLHSVSFEITKLIMVQVTIKSF